MMLTNSDMKQLGKSLPYSFEIDLPFWKKQKMMIMISIASGPNSAKTLTTQQRMYWVGKGKVANHGSALSRG